MKIGHKFCGTLTLLYSYFSPLFTCFTLTAAQQLLDDIDLIFISTFIGCCCDSRRAALIFNIFDLIFGIIGILYIVGTRSNIGAWWAFFNVGPIIISLTIAGAALYNKWLVILGALWAVISLINAIVWAARGYVFVSYNGISYPIVELVWAIIWQGLILYVSCWSLGISVACIFDSLYSYYAFVSNFQPNYSQY